MKEFLNMRYKPLAWAAVALMAGFLSGGAQAANIMTGSDPTGMNSLPDGNFQLAGHHHHHHGSGLWLGLGLLPFFGGGYGGYGGYPGYGYGGYPGYGYGGYGGYPGYGYGGYGYPYGGYGYRSYYRPRYAGAYYGGGSAHVRWCMNHYRTYRVRSNAFVGYDGNLHQCRSPYRY
jgi:BA14K-like protein